MVGPALSKWVYAEQKNKAAMFANADLVFEYGELVVRNGKVVRVTWGGAFHATPGFDTKIESRIKGFFDRYYGIDPFSFGVPNFAGRSGRFSPVPCRT